MYRGYIQTLYNLFRSIIPPFHRIQKRGLIFWSFSLPIPEPPALKLLRHSELGTPEFYSVGLEALEVSIHFSATNTLLPFILR